MLKVIHVFLLILSLCHAQQCLDGNFLTGPYPPFRNIPPSVADPSFTPPDVTLGENVISTDLPHLVAVPPLADDGILRVVMSGTGGNPLGISCLLASIGTQSRVIGLSYEFLNSFDSDRNERCHELSGMSVRACLALQHRDALYGGESYPGLWQPIPSEGSIVARLTALLEYLDGYYSDEGWGEYLINGEPNWGRIWVVGFSQGAGHANYLARFVGLAGVGLLSGPQDNMTSLGGTYLDYDYETANVRAFSHNDEGAIDIIRSNWNRMPPFGGNDGFVTSNSSGLLPEDQPWITTVDPHPNATCASANHCSTTLDNNAPLGSTGEIPYLYSQSEWVQLAGLEPPELPESIPESTESVPESAEPVPEPDEASTIIDLAVATDDLSTLVGLVTAAGLVETLSGDGNFTVFAPTNAAFAKFPADILSFLTDPNNTAVLVDILTYHVVGDAAILSTDLAEGAVVTTLNGDSITVTSLSPPTINNESVVVQVDIMASNGVVHVLDTVLIPGNVTIPESNETILDCNQTVLDSNATNATDSTIPECNETIPESAEESTEVSTEPAGLSTTIIIIIVVVVIVVAVGCACVFGACNKSRR